MILGIGRHTRIRSLADMLCTYVRVYVRVRVLLHVTCMWHAYYVHVTTTTKIYCYACTLPALKRALR